MEIASKIAEIYASAAGIIAIMWVLLARYPKKDWVKNWHIVLWFFIQFVMVHFMVLPNIVQSVLAVGIDILIACILLEGSRVEKALIIVGFNIMMILFSIIGTQIASFASGDPVLGVIAQGNASTSRIVKIVLNNMLYLLTAYIFSSRTKRSYKLKKDEVCIIAIVYGLFFVTAVLAIAVMDISGLQKQWQFIFFLWAILMLVANVVMVRLVGRMNVQNHYELENSMLKLQMRHQEEHIRQETKSYLEISALRHDIRRYFVTYQQLLKEGKYEIVQQDIEQVLEEKLEIRNRVYTENSIINAVINEKMDRCEEAKIELKVNVSIEKDWEAVDIGVMLSNLLDNAIEAEMKEPERERLIVLETKVRYKMLHMVVKNRVSASVLFDNPGLKTSKQDNELHGIGLESVRRTVRQWNGAMEIIEENGMFIVQICLGV
ncbi:MAG: GHKL domain-containing protein [Roseburia sp.]|nr:GHKL domain-containing protein [Roseburia sp.]